MISNPARRPTNLVMILGALHSFTLFLKLTISAKLLKLLMFILFFFLNESVQRAKKLYKSDQKAQGPPCVYKPYSFP